MTKEIPIGKRYRCPFAGWSGVVIDVSARGDVLIAIDGDAPERPGMIGREVWRRLDAAWLSEVRT